MIAGDERTRIGRLGDGVVAGGVALLVGLIALLALQRVGTVGVLAPLGVAVAVLLLRWPSVLVFGGVALAILGERADFGLFGVTDHLYDDIVKGVMPIDLPLMLAVLAVGLRLLRERQPVRLPPASLSLALALIALALASGLVVGHAAGVGVTKALFATHAFVYLVLVPLLIVNLGLDKRAVKRVLVGAGLLAIVKALLGLAAVATGRGLGIDGGVLTYYEPVANWLTMLAALIAVAAVLMRARPPLWLLVAMPLATASLVLSYRRSFWIGFGLALAVVVLLGLSPLGRRLVLPIVALLAAAVWMLGSVAVQSDTPLGQRLQSLSSSSITAKAEDRYRLDERANVLAALRAHPITGLGLEVPWQATARSLPVEVNPEHLYVHFAALYWWLKLGILGLAAFVATMASALALSWRIWRRAREPLLRAVGLGSLCALVGLIAIETTGSFTGVDLRFTLAFGAQLGLLAVLARLAAGSPPRAAARAAVAPAA